MVQPALAEGVYEHLVTSELDRALAAAPELTREVGAIDAAEVPGALGKHVGGVLAKVLAAAPAERADAIARSVLEHLAAEVGGESAALIADQGVVPPASRLLALHRGAVPERPTSPLAVSTLMTRRRGDPTLGHELAREIATADEVDAIIAFVTVGGVNSIRSALQELGLRPGSRLRLLTTTFQGITELRALDAFARLPGAEVRISFDTRRTRLHAKAWLFRRKSGLSTAYVGSANLTSTALGAGQEWMVKVAAMDLPHVVEQFEGTFDTLWEDSEFEVYRPDDDAQRARLEAALAGERGGERSDAERFLIALHPQPFQQEILDKLEAERAAGRRRNLVVAATGTGKTVIAALDYRRQTERIGVAPRLLFLAHREELLDQARRTFRHALQDPAFGELLVGGAKPEKWNHVFATVASAAGATFTREHFTHVVIDECHHVPADTYQALLPRLAPEILLGLTATPERADGASLLADFDGHVAAELRLWNALEEQLLVPFEYYGISDGVDLKAVRWTRAGYSAGALADVYTANDARAKLIQNELLKRVADVRKLRALGFCVSIEHAAFMAAKFTAAGIPALAVSGDSAHRDEAPGMLRDGVVNVLFTCELYNEGVDLPFVNTLLLLRPTQSSTLFLQQLGRGLRLHPQKSSCLVLDFIGQHRDEFRFDTTLAAMTGIPRARLKGAVEDGFPFLPSGCALQLDAVARKQILAALRKSIAGAKRLADDLKELAVADGARPRLRKFLADTGRDLDDVYAAGGWSTIQRRAGLIEEDIDKESERLGFLEHVDDPSRLRLYRRLAAPQSVEDRRRWLMLDSQLSNGGVLRAAEQTIEYFVQRPALVRELDELCEVLEDRVATPAEQRPVETWSLALHRHYSRREILAGVGYVDAGQKLIKLQTGILKLEDQRRELLFVTLDKSGKSFSPTTRYRDYAASPELFHWETQANASVSRPSGRRYIENDEWSFYLFVRPDPSSTFAFLGPVRYLSHAGDRPIAITWRLATPMPAALYDRYATLKPR